VNERSQLLSEQLETWFNDRMLRVEGWYKVALALSLAPANCW
jgi:hypothetical protein